MLVIKILGSGCPNCKKLAALAQNAAAQMGIETQLEKVTDHNEMMKYNILSTPGLVINEKLVSAGRIPSEAEVTSFLATALDVS